MATITCTTQQLQHFACCCVLSFGINLLFDPFQLLNLTSSGFISTSELQVLSGLYTNCSECHSVYLQGCLLGTEPKDFLLCTALAKSSLSSSGTSLPQHAWHSYIHVMNMLPTMHACGDAVLQTQPKVELTIESSL